MSKFAMSKFATLEDRAEAMGYDAGRHMPDSENCHFSAFETPALRDAWKRGKSLGDHAREEQEPFQGAA